MSSWLSSIELQLCSASLYGNLEIPKETPREAKNHKYQLVNRLCKLCAQGEQNQQMRGTTYLQRLSSCHIVRGGQ